MLNKFPAYFCKMKGAGPEPYWNPFPLSLGTLETQNRTGLERDKKQSNNTIIEPCVD